MVKRTASVNLQESGEVTKTSILHTQTNFKESVASVEKVYESRVEIPKDEKGIRNFWDNHCQSLPQTGKIGEYILENEQLLFEIDSNDIWVRVKLQMVEHHDLIEAEMDLKVEKTMGKSLFDDMI